MVGNENSHPDSILVQVGVDFDKAEAERICASIRTSAIVTLDFALVRQFDDAALAEVAREISGNTTQVILRGLSQRHYTMLRNGALDA